MERVRAVLGYLISAVRFYWGILLTVVLAGAGPVRGIAALSKRWGIGRPFGYLISAVRFYWGILLTVVLAGAAPVRGIAAQARACGVVASPRHSRDWAVGVVPAGAALLATAAVAAVISVATLGGPTASHRRHGVSNIDHSAMSRSAHLPNASRQTSEGLAALARMFESQSRQMKLKRAVALPLPEPKALASSPPISPNEVFAFLPYWELPSYGALDYSQLTTVDYFAVGVAPDGSLIRQGTGWDGLTSQDLANAVTAAHSALVRVVLTVSDFDQASLDSLLSHPVTTGARLGRQLVALFPQYGLDGVNLDLEGTGAADRTGLDRFVATVSTTLRRADPHWQVTMDTYASSASDTAGFFDVAGLASSVDAFFVMAYEMGSHSTPSPTSPLYGSEGTTVATSVASYLQVVPPSKVILGMPFYGYMWPAAGPALGDPATGPAVAVTYASVAQGGYPVYWDPNTDTPWTSFQVGSQWYQAFYDDPASVTMKVQLADANHLAGVGVWAWGMQGGYSSMMLAVAGHGEVVRGLPEGPVAPPGSPSSGSPRPGSGLGTTSTTGTTSTPGTTSTTGTTSTPGTTAPPTLSASPPTSVAGSTSTPGTTSTKGSTSTPAGSSALPR